MVFFIDLNKLLLIIYALNLSFCRSTIFDNVCSSLCYSTFIDLCVSANMNLY